MIVGIKYINDNVFYTKFKKHYCPKCKNKLGFIKKSKVINSKSVEAKKYDFSSAEGFMVGDVLFVWKEFYCSFCKIEISVDQMRKIERQVLR